MAQQFSSGSTHLWLRFNGIGSPQYFGTCESYPQDSRQPQYEFLMNDLSGSKVPLDLSYQGEFSQISMVMTRWDEDLANGFTVSPGQTSTPGQYDWEDLGTLMMLEEQFTELWIVYLYGSALANKVAYTGAGMIPGRHYLQTALWSPQMDEVGTKPMKRHFMAYAWPQIDITNKKFILYDNNMAGINLSSIV